MKYLILILIICLTLCSCSHKTQDNTINSDTTSLNKNVITQIDTDKIKINTNFPFGCAKLVEFKYPHYWEEDHEHYGRLKSPEGKELADISTLLHEINMGQEYEELIDVYRLDVSFEVAIPYSHINR